jgi:hypothetical protein
VEGPCLRDGGRGWGHPHCATEDFGGVGGVARDVKEAVLDAPVAAEGEGDAVAGEGDLDGVLVLDGLIVGWKRTFERSG